MFFVVFSFAIDLRSVSQLTSVTLRFVFSYLRLEGCFSCFSFVFGGCVGVMLLLLCKKNVGL